MFKLHTLGIKFSQAVWILILFAATQASPQTPTYEMVRIRAGSFLMGSPEDVILRRPDEQIHKVTLTRDFFMGRYEVTQELYQAITGVNPSYNNTCGTCPVERISWSDAVRFCNAASEKAGLTPAYDLSNGSLKLNMDAPGYRLPTEAEWEYACRAGTNSIFPYGDCLSSSQANFNAYLPQPGCQSGMFRGQSIPVGSFSANGWGLYDMIGNINEYCWDWYADYSAEDQIDPMGSQDSGLQVLRGGGFSIFGPRCQSGSRHPMQPEMALDFMGLRMVRTAVPVKKDGHE